MAAALPIYTVLLPLHLIPQELPPTVTEIFRLAVCCCPATRCMGQRERAALEIMARSSKSTPAAAVLQFSTTSPAISAAVIRIRDCYCLATRCMERHLAA